MADTMGFVHSSRAATESKTTSAASEPTKRLPTSGGRFRQPVGVNGLPYVAVENKGFYGLSLALFAKFRYYDVAFRLFYLMGA
jgi:hypothetical protein